MIKKDPLPVSPRAAGIPRAILFIGVAVLAACLGFWRSRDFLVTYQTDILRHNVDSEMSEIHSEQRNNTIIHTNSRQNASEVLRNTTNKGNNSSNRSELPATPKILLNNTVGNIRLNHFFAHTPKAGGKYAYDSLKTLLDLDYQQQTRNRKEAIVQETVCNVGLGRLVAKFPEKDNHGHLCKMHMSENWPRDLKKELIRHKYTIIRDPLSHVLSMYFHCTESSIHSTRAHRMPSSLDEWLQAWADARGNQTKFKENKKFLCYHPLDFQSLYVQFDPKNGRGREYLKQNFDVLGDFGKLHQSICAIFIQFTSRVPIECNCTNMEQGTRRLQFAMNNGASHGVKHHGSSFNVTEEQRRLILEDIRPKDVQLYPIVQEIFAEQVKDIERQHNFVMCESFKTTD